MPNDDTASPTSACASGDSLSFSQLSQRARAIGAESFVTVNYGSGTPAEAAAWVAAAQQPGEAVDLWEVGNESYGCWGIDNELAGPPANYRGYRPHSPKGGTTLGCPWTTEGKAVGMQTLATSYAVNAQRFMRAMKAADPAASIGVPWAFDSLVQGAVVPYSDEWNNTVLAADGKYISFVDAHYYPFIFSGGTGGANPSDQDVLRALQEIPTLYSIIRAELNAYDPKATVVIGETGVSNHPTTTACTPVGALFAAGDALSWLAAGAESVDWYDLNSSLNTTSRCVKPAFGFFTSSSPPVPETPYYGYFLASVLAQPHALLRTLVTSDPSDVLAFQSTLPGGKYALAFINLDTESAHTVTFQPTIALPGTLRKWSYGAGKRDLTNGTASAASFANGITLPAESMTVLETQ